MGTVFMAEQMKPPGSSPARNAWRCCVKTRSVWCNVFENSRPLLPFTRVAFDEGDDVIEEPW